jgi:protein-arginine kinase activator protein McsA
LRQAVEMEEFEEAARLRDLLRKEEGAHEPG